VITGSNFPYGSPGRSYREDQVDGWVDPFADIASAAMPYSYPGAIRYAEYFATAHEVLREAFGRVAAYFLTEFQLRPGAVGRDISEKERERQLDYYTNKIGLYAKGLEAAVGMLVYGVTYTSTIMPFRRFVKCPKCSTEYAFDKFTAEDGPNNWEWRDGICGRCVSCDYAGDFGTPVDRPDRARPPIVKHWNPHDVDIGWNEITDEVVYVDYVIPADVKSEIRAGRPHIIGTTPWPFVEAVKQGRDFRFDRDYVHIWKDVSLTGLRLRGRGLPRAIVNFRQLYYAQILRRMNEALAYGHVVPLKIVSPLPGGGDAEAGDFLRNYSLGDARGAFNRMLAVHTN
jgi:hypothetical protein